MSWRGIAAVGLLGVLSSFAAAQEISPELRQLQQRVEALERQNHELRQTIVDRLPPVDQADGVVRDLPAGPLRGASEDQIRSVVEEYLKQREAEEAKEAAFLAEQAAAEGHEVGSDLNMKASWRNGLELETEDGDFRVHVGGRTQFDTAWFSVPENLEANPAATGLNNLYQDGVDLRRARLRIDGTMYETIDWAVEYDFVNAVRGRNSGGTGTTDFTVPAFTDIWWHFKEVPFFQNIRVGNQKEPIGFEHLVSSRFLPFMERSFNQDSFYGGAFNGFTPGVSAFDEYADQHGTWAIGLFKPTDNVFAYNVDDGDYAVTGRLTYLPWYVDEGRGLLHVGGSFRQASTVHDAIRFRTRSPVRAGIAPTWPTPADTGVILGDDVTWLNGELAAVYDRWTFQSEYLVSFLTDAARGGVTADTLTYSGGYAQLMYFLTDDHDHYDLERGTFGRMKPTGNGFWVKGCDGPIFGRGAWQTGVRYNYLNLNNNGIDGGILHDCTVGLNWFLNPNMKLQWNYSATFRDAAQVDANGWIHGFGMRFAQDF